MQAAAKALGVNQSTVQRRIAELEERMAAGWSSAISASYRLTELGEELRPAAEGVEAAVATFERQLAACDKGLTGTIRVTCGSSPGGSPPTDAAHRHLSRAPSRSAGRAGDQRPVSRSVQRRGRHRDPRSASLRDEALVGRKIADAPGRCMRVEPMWNAMAGRSARKILRAIWWSPAATR